MNNPSPLVPEGLLEKKNQGRARVKIAVFFVLALHGVGLLALLLQGCRREDSNSAQANQPTNTVAASDTTNLPPVVEPPPTPTTTAPANTTQVAETTTAPAQPAQNDYAVASRDTYSTIAKKFNVTVKAMIEANPGVEPTKLHVGQKLHIPAPTKAVASNPSAGATAEQASSDQPYSVKSGDTLIKIATEHHTTVRAIRSVNNLKSDRILVGQKLKMPAKGSTPPPAETAATAPDSR